MRLRLLDAMRLVPIENGDEPARDKRRERKGEKECERIEHRSSKGEIARSSVAILSTIDRARERTPASIKRAFPDLRCR